MSHSDPASDGELQANPLADGELQPNPLSFQSRAGIAAAFLAPIEAQQQIHNPRKPGRSALEGAPEGFGADQDQTTQHNELEAEVLFTKSTDDGDDFPVGRSGGASVSRDHRQLSFSVGQRAITGYEHAGGDDEDEDGLGDRMTGIEEEDDADHSVQGIQLTLAARHLPSRNNLVALFEQTSKSELTFLGHTELISDSDAPNFHTSLTVHVRRSVRLHNIKLNVYSFDNEESQKLSERNRVGSVFVSVADIQQNLNEELVVELLHGVDSDRDAQLSGLNSHLIITARPELTVQQKSFLALKMGRVFRWWRDGVHRTVFFFYRNHHDGENQDTILDAEGNLGSIHWNFEPDDFDDSYPERTIDLAAISAIYEGKQTPSFLRTDRARAEVSFSVVFGSEGAETIMDLEAQSLEDRQLFLLGLHSILTGNTAGMSDDQSKPGKDEKPLDDTNVFHFTVGARNLPQQYTQSSGLSVTISTRAQLDTYTVVGKTGWISSSPFPDFPRPMNVRHVHVGQTLKFDVFFDNYKICVGTAIVKFIDLREHINEVVMVQMRNVREMEKDRELNQSGSCVLIQVAEGRADGVDEIIELDEDVEENEDEEEESVNSQINSTVKRDRNEQRRSAQETIQEGDEEADKPISQLAIDRGYQENTGDKPPVSPALFDGVVVKKHAVGKGKVEDKLVFLDASMGFGVLFWTKPSKSAPTVDNSRSIPLQTVKDIMIGKQNSVFQRKGMEKVDPDLCFSIISSKRSLDLECNSRVQRDQLVKDIINLMLPKSKAFKAFGVAGSGQLEERAQKPIRDSASSVRASETESSPQLQPSADPSGLAEALKLMKKLKDKGLIAGDGLGDNAAQLDEILGELESKFTLGPAALDQLDDAQMGTNTGNGNGGGGVSSAGSGSASAPHSAPSISSPASEPVQEEKKQENAAPSDVPVAPPLDVSSAPPLDIPCAPPLAPPLDGVPMAPPMDGVPAAPPMLGPGAPPPPPGPPGAPSFGGPKAPSAPKLDPNRKRLKQLHWDALADAEVAGTFWTQIPVSKDELISDQSHLSEIDALFLQKPVDFKRNKATPAQEGEEKVSLLDSKRVQNVEIGLRRIGMSPEALINALRQMDEAKLTDDVLSIVHARLPQLDELQKIKNFKGPKEKLGAVEKFFLQITEIPRIELRLDLQLFTIRFPPQAAELKKKLKVMFSAGKALEDSVNLKRVLGIVLHTGNYLNAGTKNGAASGFRLQTLNKLTSTKSTDNKLTLLDFIVLTVHKKYNASTNTGFLFDLTPIKEAALLDWTNILEDHKKMKATIQRMQTVLSDYESGKYVGCSPDDQFQKFLNDAYSKCFQAIKLLSKKVKRILQLEEELVAHFGESKAQMGLNQLFQIFSQFVRDYERSETEYQQKIKAKAKKEAQQRAQAGGNGATAVRISGELDASSNVKPSAAKSAEARRAALERARKKRAEAQMGPIEDGQSPFQVNPATITVEEDEVEEEEEEAEFNSIMEKARMRRQTDRAGAAPPPNLGQQRGSKFNSIDDQ